MPKRTHEESSVEHTYRAANVLLADAHSGRPTKSKTLCDLMGGGRWKDNRQFINSVLSNICAFKVKDMPHTDGGPKRNEVCLVSDLDPELQQIVNKYASPQNIQLQALQKMALFFVILSGDSISQQALVGRLLASNVASSDRDALACIHRMNTMRLLDSTKQPNQNTENALVTYSVGPLALKYYKEEELLRELRDIFGYSKENHPEELVQRNNQYLREMVKKCISSAPPTARPTSRA